MTRTLATLALALILTACSLIPIPTTGPRHDRLMRAHAARESSIKVISCDRPPDPSAVVSVRTCMVSLNGGRPQEMIVFIGAAPKEEDGICH